MSEMDKDYWKIVNFIVDNSIFIRSGSCLRCGKCCIAYDKHPLQGGVKIPCNHLSFDGKGLAICDIHKKERPKICIDNPIYPTACMVPDAIDICGYSWTIKNTLTKTNKLEMFNKLCNTKCHKKGKCNYYNEVIEELNK